MKKLINTILLFTTFSFAVGCAGPTTNDRKAAVESVFPGCDVVALPGQTHSFIVRDDSGNIFFVENKYNGSAVTSTNFISASMLLRGN